MGGNFDVFSGGGEYLGTLTPPGGGSALGCLVVIPLFAVAGLYLATALYPPISPFSLIFVGVLGLLCGLVWALVPGERKKGGSLIVVLLSALAVVTGMAMIGLFFLVYVLVNR